MTQRKDGRWVARLNLGRVNGKRKVRDFYGATKAEALEKLREAQQKHDAGQLRDPSRTTVGEYLEHWLETTRDEVRNNTYQNRRVAIRVHIVPTIGSHRLDRLNALHVEAMHAALREKGLASSTIAQVNRVLSSALGRAVRWRLVTENPCLTAGRPNGKSPERPLLSDDQLESVLQAVEGHRLHAAFVVEVNTGMRLGELLGLKWDDVDFDEATIDVRRSLNEYGGFHEGPPKNDLGRRRVPVPESVVEALRDRQRLAMAEGNAGSPWVFCGVRGAPLRRTVFRNLWNRVRADLELDEFHFHDFKHAVTSRLLGAGVDLMTVSRVVGTSPQVQLKTYAHVIPGKGREAVERMEIVSQRSVAGC